MNDDRKHGCDKRGFPLDPAHPWHPDAYPLSESAEALRERRFQERSAALQRWYDQGQWLAVLEAVLHFEQTGRPWPKWIRQAMIRLALSAVSGGPQKRRGPGGTSPASRYRNDMIHYTRWDAVTEARDHLGDTPEQSYESAAELLRGKFGHGTPGAMKKSYQTVESWAGKVGYLPGVIRMLRLEQSQEK